MLSAVIIGGGPAGSQCALWLTMLGQDVVIVEQHKQLGGLQALSPYQNNWIVGVMGTTGRQLAQRIEEHILQMDIPIYLNQTVLSIERKSDRFIVTMTNEQFVTRNVVIATGVIPRRDHLTPAENVIIGPGEFVYYGEFKNKRVAILGGGDNAAENYAFIKTVEPAQCHVYTRTIRARKHLWNKVNPADVFSHPYEVNQQNMTVQHHGETRQYDVILVLYGWEANFPASLSAMRDNLIDDRGFILTDAHCRTPVEGIYAIGEVADRMHPCVVTSMADGVVAAKAIQEGLER